MDRHKDGQTDRQTRNTQTHIHTKNRQDRHTHTHRQINRWTRRRTDRQIGRQMSDKPGRRRDVWANRRTGGGWSDEVCSQNE
jgi:hypothetical protein